MASGREVRDTLAVFKRIKHLECANYGVGGEEEARGVSEEQLVAHRPQDLVAEGHTDGTGCGAVGLPEPVVIPEPDLVPHLGEGGPSRVRQLYRAFLRAIGPPHALLN